MVMLRPFQSLLGYLESKKLRTKYNFKFFVYFIKKIPRIILEKTLNYEWLEW